MQMTESITSIRRNFLFSKTLKKEGLTYYNVEELDVSDVKRVDGVYRRMKYEETIAAYLLDIGVTETQIENIRSILIDI